jgi:HD-GYP domain-containing protein (c-di-GMP phosphodiesterase class II)
MADADRLDGIAEAIGDHLGLDPEALRTLRRAGLLHDVGKLGLSNAILDKPGRLTAAEFAQVRLHPHYSQRILSGTGRLRGRRRAGRVAPRAPRRQGLSPWPRQTGPLPPHPLPHGGGRLRGPERRPPYRGPMEVPDAMSILRAGAGTAFDPVCVSALEASLDRLAEPEPAMSETPVLGLH